MRKIVVFSGAGGSEEGGTRTFIGNNGLWEEYNPNRYSGSETGSGGGICRKRQAADTFL